MYSSNLSFGLYISCLISTWSNLISSNLYSLADKERIDPEELSYYNKIRKDMEDMKKDAVKKGIPLSFEIKEDKEKWI